jgi:hypothetical protein
MMPDSVLVDLVYPDTTLTHTNNAFTYLSWRYRANSVYDPDPTIGSGSVPGYSFWATGYNSYRVISLGYSIDLSNLETSPVDVVACPSVADLGANYTAMNELFGNPYASQALLSAKGGMDRARLTGAIDLGQFWGNSGQYLNDDGFGGSVGGNPSVSLFLNVGGVSAAAFTTGNGLDYRITLTYTTLWYGRKILVS